MRKLFDWHWLFIVVAMIIAVPASANNLIPADDWASSHAVLHVFPPCNIVVDQTAKKSLVASEVATNNITIHGIIDGNLSYSVASGDILLVASEVTTDGIIRHSIINANSYASESVGIDNPPNYHMLC